MISYVLVQQLTPYSTVRRYALYRHKLAKKRQLACLLRRHPVRGVPAQQRAQQNRAVGNHGSCSTAATPAVQSTMRSSTVRYYFPEEVPVAGLFSRASGFVDKVKSTYVSCPWVFEEFLRILTDFQLERVSRATVLIQVAELFKSNDGNASGGDLFAEFANLSAAPMEPTDANGHAGAPRQGHGACTVETIAVEAPTGLRVKEKFDFQQSQQ